MSLWALVGLGLALGIRHATDADHVVAVTAIASRYKQVLPAAIVGVFWGLGHSLTILVVGGLIILLNLAVPARVGLSFEFAVGIALTIVGALNVAGKGGFVSGGLPAHDHPHKHEHGILPAGVPSGRAFLVGLVHGLAGSAAVALLVLATVRDPVAGCAYLAVFGLGTVIGMVLITVAFASPVALVARRSAMSGVGLRFATGVLSVLFGLWIMFQVGWADGLFRSHARWIPQ
jgi:high-affinity nickel-transport protein